MTKPGPVSAKPLSVLLSDVFSDAYARQGFAARELVTRWPEIAGRDIAAHARRTIHLRDGLIEMDHAGFIPELDMETVSTA